MLPPTGHCAYYFIIHCHFKEKNFAKWPKNALHLISLTVVYSFRLWRCRVASSLIFLLFARSRDRSTSYSLSSSQPFTKIVRNDKILWCLIANNQETRISTSKPHFYDVIQQGPFLNCPIANFVINIFQNINWIVE